MTAAVFQAAGLWVLGREGGLIDDPTDPGGLTNYGIALNRHPELTAEDIRDMIPARALDIYHGPQYWQAVRGDDLPDYLAFVMLDTAINEGAREAVLCLQRALHLLVDGHLGDQTLRAAAAASRPLEVLEHFTAERIVVYSHDGLWAQDGKGWTARAVRASLEASRYVATTGATAP